MDLDPILAKARSSGRYWKLNFILQRGIPFNRQHNINIVELTEDKVSTHIPYKNTNLNHIKGIHACGLVTVAEFCSGIALMNKLGSKKYRLIMSTLRVEYHYQAKQGATASYSISDEWLQQMILDPLGSNEAVQIECEVPVHDDEQNHLCTAFITWQIKSWDKVKTKVS